MAHWLDDIIALIKREGQRFAGSSPEKGAHHETAASILSDMRDADVSHADARALVDAAKGIPRVARSGPPPFAG